MKKRLLKCIFSLVMSCFYTSLFAQEKIETTAKAQVNSWGTLNFSDPLQYQLGARFIPEINFEKVFGKINFDAQFSFNTTGSLDYREWNNICSYERFKPYRMWARLSGSHFEVRLGLQKINFGSAMMLRPLMWFDRIDPRDPLQLTDGVYALLGRYYFKNNANIWLWGLIGNNQTKGWEAIPSTKNDPEFGGRFQFPVSTGEAALTFHHRTADLAEFYNDTISLTNENYPQNRYALDGKWDVGVGLWFEYVLEENKIRNESYPFYYQNTASVGMDYTFDVGNGLHASTEFFYISKSDKFLSSEVNAEMSALSVNYPLGLINQITAIVYYSWEDGLWYRFINFQKTYDYWSFYFMGFWNPERFELYNLDDKQNLFTGKGIQIMAVYNF